MMRTRRGIVFCLAATLGLGGGLERTAAADPPTPSQTYRRSTMQNPQTVGMNGALNAVGDSFVGVFLNPATLPLSRAYHLEGFGAWALDAEQQHYGLAAVDSVTSQLAGGLAGTWSRVDRNRALEARFALAYLFSPSFSLGVAGRYVHAEQAFQELTGTEIMSPLPQDKAMGSFTLDTGVVIALLPELRIGLVGHNLIRPPPALSPLAPTTLAGGIGYTDGTVRIEVGGLVDFTTAQENIWTFQTGGEWILAQHLPLRAGYSYEQPYEGHPSLHSVSLGIAYLDSLWGIELGARRNVSTPHPNTLLTASLRLCLDPPR